MKDYLQKAYCFNKMVRVYAARTTEACEHARKIHGLWPTSAAALGRTLTVGALMGAMYKSNERLSIRVEGDGPASPIIVEVNGNGDVRGFVKNPEVFMQYNNGKLNVGYAVGSNGFIHVTKDLNLKEPFTSSSNLVTGEIAEDFTYYFAISEQVPSSVGLGVKVDTDNSVIAAGGFILQIMPGCPDEVITRLETILGSLKPASQMIEEGYTPEDMIREITLGDYEILETKEINYFCDCSYDRFRRGIKTLGINEIKKIIEEDHGCETQCHFCHKVYDFSENDLKEIITEIEDEKNV